MARWQTPDRAAWCTHMRNIPPLKCHACPHVFVIMASPGTLDWPWIQRQQVCTLQHTKSPQTYPHTPACLHLGRPWNPVSCLPPGLARLACLFPSGQLWSGISSQPVPVYTTTPSGCPHLCCATLLHTGTTTRTSTLSRYFLPRLCKLWVLPMWAKSPGVTWQHY